MSFDFFPAINAIVPIESLGSFTAGTNDLTVDKNRQKIFLFHALPTGAGGGTIEVQAGIGNSLGAFSVGGTGAFGAGYFVVTYDAANNKFMSWCGTNAGTGGTQQASATTLRLILTGDLKAQVWAIVVS